MHNVMKTAMAARPDARMTDVKKTTPAEDALSSVHYCPAHLSSPALDSFANQITQCKCPNIRGLLLRAHERGQYAKHEKVISPVQSKTIKLEC